MAIHEYLCLTCNSTYEIEHKITEDPIVICEKCDRVMEKQFPLTPTRFKIKGSCHRNEYTKFGRNPDGSTTKVD